MIPWGQFHRVGFERGIAIEKTEGGSWRYSQSSSSSVSPPSSVAAHLGVRPLVAAGTAGCSEFELIFPSKAGRFLDVYRSELDLPLSVASAMGAMLYHLKALATWTYSQCLSFGENPHVNREKGCVISPTEPYYEFDALLSAVVRGFAYSTIPLWKRFGSADRPPRNFTGALDKAPNIPEDLRNELKLIHDQTYSTAKEYRDCIHHNVDLGSASWAMMQPIADNLWSVLVRVPDNPETKSRNAFRFDRNLDALTLGWEYVSSFCAFADTLFGASALSKASLSANKTMEPTR